MKLSQLFRASSVAFAVALFASAGAKAGVIVDLFSDPPGGQGVTDNVLTGGAAVTDQNVIAYPATILGGYRDLSVNKLSDTVGLVDGQFAGSADITVGGGALSLTNGDGITSKGVITWDGVNNAGADGSSVNTMGLGGVDLTFGGSANQFLADVLFADLGFGYDIKVWDIFGHASTLSASVQFPIPAGPYGSHYLFQWFNLSSGTYCDGVLAPPACSDPLTQLDFTISRSGAAGDIDFTKIGALQIVLYNGGAGAAADFALGTTRTVPEPGTLALLGLALAGAGFATRRSRSA